MVNSNDSITGCHFRQVAAIPFRWATFLRSPQNARQPFYAAFLPEATASQHGLPASLTQLPQPPADAHAADAVALSEAVVAAAVAEAVRAALGDGVSSSTPLLQAGLDSLGERDVQWCQCTMPWTAPRSCMYESCSPAHLCSAL
jgi:hypothetical protein